MRYREPFKVFKKKLKSGNSTYYYTTYDDFNKRKQYSTGCRTKNKALKYCYNLFKEDNLIRETDILFSTFTKDWYIYESCPYIKSRLLRGKQYSKSAAKNNRAKLENKILPMFGHLEMNKISTTHIEEYIEHLKKDKLSNSTININLSTLNVILKEAYRQKIIKENPFNFVQCLEADGKSRTTLAEKEIFKLFEENNIKNIWIHERYYIMTLLASQTGMRIGEVQALLMTNIHKDYIEVKHTWDVTFGLKGTKTGVNRIVPITNKLYLLLKQYSESHNKKYIFANTSDKPVTVHAIQNAFYKALINIGISEEERKKRNITFHSWRHYYNTELIKQGVPLPIIQAIIGHSSNAMTSNYTKLTKEDLINAVGKS